MAWGLHFCNYLRKSLCCIHNFKSSLSTLPEMYLSLSILSKAPLVKYVEERDRDQTDFRKVHESYSLRVEGKGKLG